MLTQSRIVHESEAVKQYGGKLAYFRKQIIRRLQIVQQRLCFQVQDLNLAVEGLEKERDFYFTKLRDVEMLCQDHESDELPIVKQILDILYATEVGQANSYFFDLMELGLHFD